MVLVIIFRVENDTFTEQLRTVIQEDDTTRAILEKISYENVEGFAKDDKFLLF